MLVKKNVTKKKITLLNNYPLVFSLDDLGISL